MISEAELQKLIEDITNLVSDTEHEAFIGRDITERLHNYKQGGHRRIIHAEVIINVPSQHLKIKVECKMVVRK